MITTDTELIIPVSTEPAAVLQAFTAYLHDEDRSPNTVSSFIGDINLFSSWCAAEYKTPFTLENFNRHDLRAFQRHFKDNELMAPASWNCRISGLKVYSKWLQRVGLLTYDPTDVLKRAEEQSHAPRWMTDPEYRAFTVALELYVNAKCKGVQQVRHDLRQRDYALIALMLYAGLRVAEVCSLNVGDIQLGERSGMVTVRLGKGRKLRRVPLSKEARASLIPWMDLRRGDGQDPLFLSTEQTRITVRMVQRLVARIGRMARLDGISPHDLRHTCARRMAKAGARLEVIKDILGHASLNTTIIYVQAGWEDLEAAVELI
jgi:site-specific recombinase XerD